MSSVTRVGRRSRAGLAKSSSMFFRRLLRSLNAAKIAELKSIFRKTPSSLARFVSSIFSSAILISSDIGFIPLLVQVIEARPLGEYEAFALQPRMRASSPPYCCGSRSPARVITNRPSLMGARAGHVHATYFSSASMPETRKPTCVGRSRPTRSSIVAFRTAQSPCVSGREWAGV
jgi:hypothetical protein